MAVVYIILGSEVGTGGRNIREWRFPVAHTLVEQVGAKRWHYKFGLAGERCVVVSTSDPDKFVYDTAVDAEKLRREWDDDTQAAG